MQQHSAESAGGAPCIHVPSTFFARNAEMVLFLETKGCCQTFWGNMLCNEKLSGCRVLPAAGRWQQQGRRRERLSQSGIPVSPVPCSCIGKGFTQTREDGDWHSLKHHLSLLPLILRRVEAVHPQSCFSWKDKLLYLRQVMLLHPCNGWGLRTCGSNLLKKRQPYSCT